MTAPDAAEASASARLAGAPVAVVTAAASEAEAAWGNPIVEGDDVTWP
ncbi:hypothetical protein [Streptomyces sp. SPB4]|nr:hypothetical protein [Streptomyces sp. SPB4]